MPIPVPSHQADKANDEDSVGIDDVMPVAGSRPRKAHNGPGRTPFRGPQTMTQSLVRTSRATTPPGKHVACPGEAFAVKEAADGHVTGPQARTRSPVRTAKATTSPGKHVANPGEALAVKEAANDHDDLCHGMAPLREQMAVPGITAFRFAATIEDINPEDNWADTYGTFVATLRDKSTALATALAPEAAAQAYLTLDLEAKLFLVVHGLHWWVSIPPSRSSNKGHLVTFEGETLQGGEPPDLWRFEGDDDKLFELAPLAKTVLSLVAQFYRIPGKNDNKWFDKAGTDETGLWISRLIPIPTGWAALFLDYPDLGMAFHRVTDLINSVAKEKVGNFKILAWQMAYACH
jgi:hypothetical protein